MSADGRRMNRFGLDRRAAAGDYRPRRFGRALGRARLRQDVRAHRAFLGRARAGRQGRRRPHLSQLVAITFTERAAREMRDRIRKACRERLRGCPAEQAGYWLALLRELDSARISTIHSFCGGLLRAHAVEAGIDPRFRVLDAAQASTLLFELSDEVLRDRLAARDEAALALVTRFGLDRLREMIARLLAERAEIDWPLWERETPEGLVGAVGGFLAPRHGAAHLAADQRVGRGQNGARSGPALSAGPCQDARAVRFSAGTGLAVQASRCTERSSRPAASARRSIREKAKVQGGGTKKHWVNEDVYNQFRDAAKTLRDAIDDVAERMQFDPAAARPAAALALATARPGRPTWPAL